MNTTAWVKNTLIVIACIILALIFHGITSQYSTIPKEANYSIIVKHVGVLATIIIWYVIAFGGIAIIYNFVDMNISQYRFNGGLRYGIALYMLWQWGMLEGVAISNNPFINELVTGVSDAVPLLIMGILMGIIKGDKKQKYFKKIYITKYVITILVFSIVFTSIRYMAYCTNIMQSGYVNQPLFTAIWTIIMGMVIGVVYILLGENLQGESKMLNLIKFSVVVFGINWCLFIIFIPFIFESNIIACAFRVIIDVVSVIISCIIVNYLMEDFTYI